MKHYYLITKVPDIAKQIECTLSNHGYMKLAQTKTAQFLKPISYIDGDAHTIFKSILIEENGKLFVTIGALSQKDSKFYIIKKKPINWLNRKYIKDLINCNIIRKE